MDRTLIFDVGMHRGEDTAFYLALGYRVVAVEADPGLIQRAQELFTASVENGSLVLVDCAIANHNGLADFYLSKKSIWNSLTKAISDRDNALSGSVIVKTRRLDELFSRYGVPLYCKIDIEGHDARCLASLHSCPELPTFMSVETECVGAGECLAEWQSLETLRRLTALGYDEFKLIDQVSFAVLEPPSPGTVVTVRALRAEACLRVRQRCGYDFPQGSTGPFGELLDGQWLDKDVARETLLYYRRLYFRSPRAVNYGFWCDWQARRSDVEAHRLHAYRQPRADESFSVGIDRLS